MSFREEQDQHDLDDRDLPDPSDMDQDDDVVLSRCPYCKKMIGEDSEICPKCGSFISSEDSTEPGKTPKWFLIGLGIAILVIIFAWLW